jgi:hypothetical protein
MLLIFRSINEFTLHINNINLIDELEHEFFDSHPTSPKITKIRTNILMYSRYN